MILFQLRHSQRVINRLQWFANIFHLFKGRCWAEGVLKSFFSSSMRSLYKIYGKLRTHLKINSRLPVIWETVKCWTDGNEKRNSALHGVTISSQKSWHRHTVHELCNWCETPLCFLCTLAPCCDETASLSHGSKSHCLLLSPSVHMLTLLPAFAYVPILFFHWDFINGVLFLFVALLIQKLDSDLEKHDLFLAKQRANAKAFNQDYRKRKMLPVLKNKFMFHISLNLMLFWCLCT